MVSSGEDVGSRGVVWLVPLLVLSSTYDSSLSHHTLFVASSDFLWRATVWAHCRQVVDLLSLFASAPAALLGLKPGRF